MREYSRILGKVQPKYLLMWVINRVKSRPSMSRLSLPKLLFLKRLTTSLNYSKRLVIQNDNLAHFCALIFQRRCLLESYIISEHRASTSLARLLVTSYRVQVEWSLLLH